MNEHKKDEPAYGYWAIILMMATVVISWGVVPGLAKLGDLGGGATTFYVNWIAVLSLALIITAKGVWKKFADYSSRDFMIMVLLGIAWPLVYSVAYFEGINQGGPALITILNYLWPAAYMVAAFALTRRKFSRGAVIAIGTAIAAVAVVQCLDASSVNLALVPVLLGLVAAGTQGFYSAASERWEYEPLTMTFVVEVVTAVGVSFYVLVMQEPLKAAADQLFYLAIIGAISNGLGFWAFLAGNQMSGKMQGWKTPWLIAMCLVPVVQVVFLPLVGIEVSQYNWIGVAVVATALLIYRLSERNLKQKAVAESATD